MKRISEAERRAHQSAIHGQASTRAIAERMLSRGVNGRLMVSFPKHFGVKSKGPIDLTHLDGYPGIKDAFVFGYVMHCLGVNAADRRYDLNQHLRSGFLRFLDDTRQENIELVDITESVLRTFKSWLDDEDSVGWLPSKLSRRQAIQEVQLILKQLMADKHYSVRLSPDLKLLIDPYPEAKKEIQHTEALNDEQLERLFVSAANDAEQIIKRVEATNEKLAGLLADGGISDPNEILDDPVRCAGFLIHRFGGKPPGWEAVTRKVAWKKNINREIYEGAVDTLFPRLDELLPFVLLLALLFAYNPGVVLNMARRDYEMLSFAGCVRIRLHPFKGRKRGPHRASVVATNDSDNPARILSFLEDRTKRLRLILRKVEFSDRVFIRYSWAERAGIPLELSDKTWREAVQRFCIKHDLEYFTLQQIRPTTLDLAHELTGSDLLAVARFGDHASPDTTKDYYSSAAMLRREEEMLGAGMSQWWRFVESKGKVDPTERDRRDADLWSATPGFGCADPYSSPIEGERPGVLCRAYGRCPVCEHAMINLSSPHAYAYQRELLRQIDAAQASLGPPWLVRWAPVREKLLTRCLIAFPREVIIASGSVSIPPLPAVD